MKIKQLALIIVLALCTTVVGCVNVEAPQPIEETDEVFVSEIEPEATPETTAEEEEEEYNPPITEEEDIIYRKALDAAYEEDYELAVECLRLLPHDYRFREIHLWRFQYMILAERSDSEYKKEEMGRKVTADDDMDGVWNYGSIEMSRQLAARDIRDLGSCYIEELWCTWDEDLEDWVQEKWIVDGWGGWQDTVEEYRLSTRSYYGTEDGEIPWAAPGGFMAPMNPCKFEQQLDPKAECWCGGCYE